MSKRCQVCGGPVSEGRCRLCGMPYRNDEVLYHLNENRRDHYRHATGKARRIMRELEQPQSGWKTSGGKAPGETVRGTGADRNTGGAGKETGRAAAAAGGRASGQKTEAKGSGARTAASGTKNAWVEKERRNAGREKGGGGKVLLLLLIVVFASAVISAVAATFKNSGDSFAFGQAKLREKMEDGEYLGYLLPGQDLLVGDSIPRGNYVLYIEDGFAGFRVSSTLGSGYGTSESRSLSGEGSCAFLELEEGQTISFASADDIERRLEFYLVS